MGFIIKCVNHDGKIMITYDDQDFQRKFLKKMIHNSGHWDLKEWLMFLYYCILLFVAHFNFTRSPRFSSLFLFLGC
jgi:hypothetical protein